MQLSLKPLIAPFYLKKIDTAKSADIVNIYAELTDLQNMISD
jgi:hypothetical protein